MTLKPLEDIRKSIEKEFFLLIEITYLKKGL
jgi:hypothetical protein